jgi:hypothetical protein
LDAYERVETDRTTSAEIADITSFREPAAFARFGLPDQIAPYAEGLGGGPRNPRPLRDGPAF